MKCKHVNFHGVRSFPGAELEFQCKDCDDWLGESYMEETFGRYEWRPRVNHLLAQITPKSQMINEKPKDNVNHPAHYTQGGIECIDAMAAALNPEEFRGFCKGNALKYVWREASKNGDEDLQKAVWYLNRLTQKGKQDGK